MTTWSSQYTIDGRSATLDMAYDGATIPQVTFADSIVSIQSRPAITTTVKGLRFFVNEALFWNSVVEPRLPIQYRARQNLDCTNTVTFTTVGTEDRADSVSLTAHIAGITDGVVQIVLTWSRTTGVLVMEARPVASMRWAEWLDFLHIHEQFLGLVENGRRVL